MEMRKYLILLVLAAANDLESILSKSYNVCQDDVTKVSCYLHEDFMPLIKEVKYIYDKSTGEPVYFRFGNAEELMEKVVCGCFDLAAQLNYSYFAIAHWDECYLGISGKLPKGIPTQGEGCLSWRLKPCNMSSKEYCVGSDDVSVVYKVKDIDGKYSNWTPWSPCSVTCGAGTQERKRKCIYLSSRKGKDCSTLGPSYQQWKCEMAPCHSAHNSSICKRNYTSDTCLTTSEIQHIMTTLLTSHSERNGDMVHRSVLNSGGKFSESMRSLACHCADIARKRGIQFISIRFGWECYGGINDDALQNVITSKKQSEMRCVDEDLNPCYLLERACVGKRKTDIIFDLSQEKSIHGNYSPWSRWTVCSKPCGHGIQSRTRTCTNPRPKNGGQNCSHLGDHKLYRYCFSRSCTVRHNHSI